MKMLKRILLVALPLLMTACSVTEVRERQFIQTAALYHKSGKEYVVLHPFDSESSVAAAGETLLTALETAEGLLGGALFLGHTELLGVGRGDLTENLEELLDGNRISPSCKLMYSPDGTVDSALIPVLSQMADSGQLIAPSCGDALRHLLGRSEKTVLPALDDGTLTLAVVDADGNRLAFLDETACRGLFWLTGESAELTLAVNSGDEVLYFAVTDTRASLQAYPAQDGLKIVAELSVKGDLSAHGGALAAAAEAEVKRICAAALRQTVTACGADVIGIETAAARADRAYYLAHEADWEELLRTAEIEVRVDVRAA